MTIVLINPPQFSSSHQVTAGLVPPLGLLYLSSVLKKNHFEVRFIDGLGEKPNNYYKCGSDSYRGVELEEILKRITDETKIVGISCMFSMNHLLVMNLVSLIKNTYPNIIIILGGAHITALPNFILNTGLVDIVCLGESENSFLKVCQSLRENNWKINLLEIKKIKGIGCRNEEELYLNEEIELIKDIDSLPYPDWDSIPIENYFALKQSHGSLRSEKWTIMLFSRGCPYNCSFCNTPYIWKKRWRVRDPKKVVEEIIYLQKKYGIEEVHFEDENISTNSKKLHEFCDEIINQNIKIKWQAANGMRPNGIDEILLRKMIKSGCTNVVFAPESGSYRVLDKIIDKRMDLSEIIQISKITNKLKIKTAIYFIMGLPGERKKDIFKTLKFMLKLARIGADECIISLFAPLPGSRIFYWLLNEKKIILNDDFFKSSIAMGDLGKAKSWSKHINDRELKFYQLIGYLSFHFTKMVFHPTKTLNSIHNVLQGKQELKTERLLISKFKRNSLKK